MTIGIGVWIRWDKSSEIRQLLEEVVDPAVMVIIAGEDLTYCFTNVLLVCVVLRFSVYIIIIIVRKYINY